MSTRKDVENKLRAMDGGDLNFIAAAFEQEQRLASDGDDVFITWLLDIYDVDRRWKLKLLRELDLPTADEARTDAAAKALDAAERSADAAVRSARAAEKSETHARSSKTATWITVGLTFIAVAAAVVALLKSFHIIGD